MGDHHVHAVGEFTVHEHTRDHEQSIFYLTNDDMGCLLTEPVVGIEEFRKELKRLKRLLDRAGRS